MQRSTFKVLFYVKRQSEKHGQVPVMGRITINGTMSQFSCKLSVRSSLWDAKANKAAGRSLESQRINEKLENIKTNIGKQYQRLCDRDSYVTAEKVRNAFLGMGDDCRLLLQTFDTLQISASAWAKTALIPVMRTTANAAGVWPPSSNTSTASRTLRSKS